MARDHLLMTPLLPLVIKLRNRLNMAPVVIRQFIRQVGHDGQAQSPIRIELRDI